MSNIIKASGFQPGIPGISVMPNVPGAAPAKIEKFVIDSNQKATLLFTGLQKSLETAREEGTLKGDGLPGLEDPSILIPLEVEQAIKEQAAVILEEAREEERRIKEQALKEAKIQKNSVLEAAREEGFQQGLARGEARIKELEAELYAQKEEQQRSYEKQVEALEPLFSDLVIRYVEKLTGYIMEENRPVIRHLMKEAIQNAEAAKLYTLRVPKEVYEEAQAQEAELQSLISARASLEILADSSLQAGECRLETENCVIDSGLGTRLEILKENLRLLAEGR